MDKKNTAWNFGGSLCSAEAPLNFFYLLKSKFVEQTLCNQRSHLAPLVSQSLSRPGDLASMWAWPSCFPGKTKEWGQWWTHRQWHRPAYSSSRSHSSPLQLKTPKPAIPVCIIYFPPLPVCQSLCVLFVCVCVCVCVCVYVPAWLCDWHVRSTSANIKGALWALMKGWRACFFVFAQTLSITYAKHAD